MPRWSSLAAIIPLILLAMQGCGAGLEGLWTGSGEVGEGLFFRFTLDIEDADNPSAIFEYSNGIKVTLAVCDLKEEEGAIEFRMDPDARAATCDTMVLPYRFVGRLGEHLITGKVLDGDNKMAGLFRAFRNRT